MLKKIQYTIEAIFVYIFFFICKILPIDVASYILGKLFQIIGPCLDVSNIAHKNLSLCFPNMTKQEKQRIVSQMWNNLGRIVGELPHWQTISDKEFDKRVVIKNYYGHKKQPLKSALFLSAHYGNWELFPRFLKRLGLKLALVYRPVNNPYVDSMIKKSRVRNNMILIKKGVSGIRKILEGLKSGYLIGMLIDQKTNDGIDVPFFNISAKTTSAPANLSIKFGVPIILAKVTRTKGANYIIELHSPLIVSKDNDSKAIMTKINLAVEGWAKEEPAQWFWVHKRWDKKYYVN